MIVATLVGCGNAEARPFKGDRLLVRHAIVGDAYQWCDASAAWKIAHQEFARVTRGQVPIDMEFDVATFNDRPDLLTLDHFWDSSLGRYWIGVIKPDPKSIRHVALPPLINSDGRRMYGGMHYGRGVLGSWFFTNVEPKNDCRNAATLAHEWAHSFGVRDDCNPTRSGPDVMCWEDAPIFRDCKAPIRYSAIQERQIRRKLGLSAGKTLVIGGRDANR